MKQLNSFQSFVARVCRINLEDAAVKFSVNQALAEQRRQGKEEGRQEGRQEKVDCMTCLLYKQAQMHNQLQQQPPGRYAVYHKDMERKKFTTRQLDPTRTDILEKAPSNFDAMIHGDGGTPRMHKMELLYIPPAFLNDRKIS